MSGKASDRRLRCLVKKRRKITGLERQGEEERKTDVRRWFSIPVKMNGVRGADAVYFYERTVADVEVKGGERRGFRIHDGCGIGVDGLFGEKKLSRGEEF
jgi:hypothetical protein